ncbi:espin-like [Haliotis rubra]|uniref:espin-like n=1 Tax=Haliotis rubra TaxID=36100 RepID=UPI001EE5574F|nr:espin-like [Haliotis rubra]
MHDRGLSANDRKRMALASGHIPLPGGMSPRIARRVAPGQPKPKAQQTVASVRRNLSIGREMSRDFLTLACYNAIATGQMSILKAIYKTGKAPQVDKNGNTPLHVAAKCGQLRSLRWLLQHSNVPLLAKNARGETCLHVAALQGHLKCMQTIIVCKKEKPSIAVSERDNLGMTGLHHATIGNRERLVHWLVQEFGKDLCLVKSCDGVLAIHLAAAAGATPVFYAAQEGHLECLQYLVEHMDGSLKIVAFEGMTAFLSAAEGGHLHVMNYLLEKQGSDALLSTTNDGATVFHYVASTGNFHILQYLLGIPNIGDLLRVTDAFDRNPAHDAAENGFVECLRMLVEAGISLYLPDKDGETPLSLAMRSGNPKCVLFARAVADSTMDMASLKMLKKKLGSKFNQISGIVTVQALSRDAAICFKRDRKSNTVVVFRKHEMSCDQIGQFTQEERQLPAYCWADYPETAGDPGPQ